MTTSRWHLSRKPLMGLSALLASALLLVGCGGGGGGSTGPEGPVGPVGPPGGGSPEDPNAAYEPLPGVVIVITSMLGGTGIGGNFKEGDTPTVFFTVKDNAGHDIDVPSMDSGSIYVSGPTFNYQRVIASQSNLRAASVAVGGGVWSYTFPVPIPAAYLPPLNDTPSFGPADGELAGQPLLDGTYTVGMQAYVMRMVGTDEFRDAGNATFDFLFGDAIAIDTREVITNANCNACHTTISAHGGSRKDVRLCVLCHTAGAEDRNTAAGGTPGVSIDFRVMIHKLHNGGHLPSVLGIATNLDGSRDYLATPKPYEIVGFQDSVNDFSEVNFPVWPNLNVAVPKALGYSALPATDPDGAGPLLSQKSRDDTRRTGVTACDKCHGDPDGAGPLPAPAHGDLYYNQPSMQACGSCHDDIDWTKPYTKNGSTMPIQPANGACLLCHSPSGGSLPTKESHVHPLNNPAIDAGVRAAITAITGGTGAAGSFQNGDSPTIELTLKNDAGTDIGIASMDAASSFFLGPTINRQLVMPLTSPNGQTLTPYDFTGRLHATSTSGKGSMSKVFLGATAVKETLVVEFTSSTAFSVTGKASGPLGAGALPAATSTMPSGASVSAFDLGPTLVTGTATVVFSSATAFTVTVLGAPVGGGTLPNPTSASTRFKSPTFSFNITVGSAPFAAGNTFNIALFKGGALNPVTFAVVAGTTAFSSTAGAPDRFYYEVTPDAASYLLTLPMDHVFEFLGDSTATPSQVLPGAGNLPVYYGRQQLFEAATTATTTLSTAAVFALSRQMDVSAATGFANSDTVVIEPASGIGFREYVQIAPARADGVIAAAADTTVRLFFKTPLRYAHASSVVVTKVTTSLKQEGASNAYTINSATGTITSNGPFTAARALVMSYRSDARFGYRRHPGDALQTTYVPPANDSIDIGQDRGEWKSLPYLAGTYTADIWFARNIDLGQQNELQTYRSTSDSATKDFLFGGATTIVPRAVISSPANCYSCHNDVIFHGGGRRGVDTCLTCHSVAGSEDKPRWDTPLVSGTTTPTALTPGVAIEFRQMLHKIHKGEELAFASTYTVVGNGGSPSTYGEVVFPALPGGTKQCVKCHGNDSWQVPAPREQPSALVSTRVWGVVCGSCHDSDAAQAHITVSTPLGVESCEVCHGPDAPQDVVKVHFPR